MAGMREGEVCELSPINPGLVSGPSITADLDLPPHAYVSYTVRMVSFRRASPVWEMAGRELLRAAQQLRDAGRQLFKSGHMAASASCFSRAVKLVLAVPDEAAAGGTAEDVVAAEEKDDLRRVLCLNLAACQLALGLNGHAFQNCTRVLERGSEPRSSPSLDPDPLVLKARYRRGVAALRMGDAEQAERDLSAARDLDPGNKEVQLRLREMAKLRQRQDAQLSAALSSMFASPSPTPSS